MTLVGTLAACSGQVVSAVGAEGVGGSGGASSVNSSVSSAGSTGTEGASASSASSGAGAGGTNGAGGGGGSGATSTSSGMSDAGLGDAGCTMSLFYDDSCDKLTASFSTFTQVITVQGTGTIEKFWAGIGSWSQPSTYTLTLTTTQQTATYPNLAFSPRMDQGYMQCGPLNNMAGAALPAGFPVSDAESLTITVSGTDGELHQDSSGKVRMGLEGSHCGG